MLGKTTGMQTFDSIVVGAGIEGSATAYHLVKNGQKTLLLEQFPLPHSRGSSHGQSRIIRRAYEEHFFASMMDSANEQWRQLEQDTGTRLLDKIGYLLMAKSPHKILANTERALQNIGAKYEKLSAAQTRQRFPLLNCKDDYQCIYEPGGGGLRADKCLLAYQGLYTTLGGTTRDNERVLTITPGVKVTVKTDKGAYVTSSLVITAGPWTSKLTVPLGLNLPLNPIRMRVCYWKVTSDGAYSASAGFPVFFIAKQVHEPGGSMANVFGVPTLEYPDHIKVCAHTGPSIDPEQRDQPTDTWDLTELQRVVREFFPGAQPTPSIQEPCIYTMTPDSIFILDTHPKWRNIIIGAGFSGTGFKLAPVVGQVLTDLAMGRRPSHDLGPFQMNRFPGVTVPDSKL